jgi:hypothetical protein
MGLQPKPRAELSYARGELGQFVGELVAQDSLAAEAILKATALLVADLALDAGGLWVGARRSIALVVLVALQILFERFDFALRHDELAFEVDEAELKQPQIEAGRKAVLGGVREKKQG